jgi:tetratricopeptide (TPR) repeat protein
MIAVAVAVTGCSSSKGNKPSSSASQIAKLLQDGVVAQNGGQLDIARAKYLKVLDIDPKNKIAHYDLGVIDQQVGDNVQAAAEYGRAIAIDPKYVSALFNYAVLESNGNRAHAIELYRKILVLRPKDANVHFNLGLVLQATGDKAGGDAELQKAFRLSPALRKRLPSSAPASTTPAPTSSATS